MIASSFHSGHKKNTNFSSEILQLHTILKPLVFMLYK